MTSCFRSVRRSTHWRKQASAEFWERLVASRGFPSKSGTQDPVAPMLSNFTTHPRGSVTHRTARRAGHPYCEPSSRCTPFLNDLMHRNRVRETHAAHAGRKLPKQAAHPQGQTQGASRKSSPRRPFHLSPIALARSADAPSTKLHLLTAFIHSRASTPSQVGETFIEDSSFGRGTSSVQPSAHISAPAQVPFRAIHASKEMRSLMGVFRLNPFSLPYGAGREPSDLLWNGETPGPLAEAPRLIEFQLEGFEAEEFKDADLSRVSRRPERATASRPAEMGRTEEPQPLWLMPDWETERIPSPQLETYVFNGLSYINPEFNSDPQCKSAPIICKPRLCD